MSSLQLGLGLCYRRQLPSLYRCLTTSWNAGQFGRLAFSSSAVRRENAGSPAKAPLDPEWAEMAKKQLKGADPEEKLTWQTPEVCIFSGLFLPSCMALLFTGYPLYECQCPRLHYLQNFFLLHGGPLFIFYLF